MAYRKGRPDEIFRAPLCQAALRGRRPSIREPYDKYDDWLLAEEIADPYSEKKLRAAGVDFNTMSGGALIMALEKMLMNRSASKDDGGADAPW